MSIGFRSCSRGLLTLLLGFSASSVFCAVPNRIAAIAQEGSARVAVQNTVPARARLASDAGSAAGDERLSSVVLHFSLSDAQQTDLEKLLEEQQNPSSPLYHQWLTPQEFGARFGLSSSDMSKVKTWLQSQGLSVTSTSPSMNYVTVSGTVSQVESAFGTSIHTLTVDGETHISNLSDPTLPTALARVVGGITGLNDFKPKARAHVSQVRSEIVQPRYTSSISGNHYIAPGDLHTIYNINPLLQNSITGSGITIAIAGQTDISTSDVAAFRSASGLPAATPTIVQVPNMYTAGTSTDDIDEAQLDVEWSGAAAPGATIKFVTVGVSRTASVMDALVYAITSKAAPIITVSYGACEVSWGQTLLNTYNGYFQQANAQGITIVGPSGDSGATDCDYGKKVATQGLSVDFPASSPYVTGAGGTMFSEGTGTYWGSSNGLYQGSALSYIPEVVWNESSTSTGLSAAGGGVSKYISKPSWQVGTGVPSDSFRDVPDISLNSAASHDGYLFCSQSSCVNGFRDSSSNLNVVGGTSVASPAFAGILALLEQYLQSSGLGNANPKIYGLANSTYYGNVFHDVTSGNNNSPCTTGTTDCTSGGSIGYSAGTGYDLATGWGSIDAYNFVTKWNLVAAVGSTGSTATGDFTLTASPTTASVKSGSSTTITLTLGSSSGFTGAVLLSASGVTSSGSGLAAKYSFSPSSVSLSSGGSTQVTMTLTAAQTSAYSRPVLPIQIQAAPASPRYPLERYGAGALLSGVLLIAVPRRRSWAALLAIVLSVSVMSVAGCGGGGTASSSSSGSGSSSSSSSSSSSTTSSSTAVSATAGTYTVTITGVSGTLSHTATVQVTVTN